MAEARAICSKGWPITLLGLVCCAAEADVLSDSIYERGQFMPMDAASGAPGGGGGTTGGAVTSDAGFLWDADVYPDASAVYPAPLDASRGPTWTSCDPSGSIFERGRIGDSCQFTKETGCSTPPEDCTQRTAKCVNGVLHLAQVGKSECVPDEPLNSPRCAEVDEMDGCCISLWQCAPGGPLELSGDEPIVRVCALSCEPNVTVIPVQGPVTSCPYEPDAVPWPRFPPEAGLGCSGSFVCDAVGNRAGPETVFQFGEHGLIYWCDGHVVQRTAIGTYWPWSEPPVQG